MFKTIVEETLPNALMIGVDYDLFWRLNPKSLSAFIKAFSLKQEYDDMLAWKQGAYIQMAIGSCLSKQAQYPRKPLLNSKGDTMSAEEIKSKMIRRMNELNSRFEKEV